MTVKKAIEKRTSETFSEKYGDLATCITFAATIGNGIYDAKQPESPGGEKITWMEKVGISVSAFANSSEFWHALSDAGGQVKAFVKDKKAISEFSDFLRENLDFQNHPNLESVVIQWAKGISEMAIAVQMTFNPTF